jgi:caspase domain-containing protein
MYNDWAIVVGVRRYPGISDLDGSEHDAEDFRNWLVDPAGGAVPPTQVKLILSSQFTDPSTPTNTEVERAFEWLDDEAEKNRNNGDERKVGRRLYLYFSGHGYAPSRDDAALLMANATPRRSGNHIAGRLWAEWFYEAGYFEEIALFMDCCRDSYTTVGMRPAHLNRVLNTNGINDRKRFYAYGTEWDRKAWERLNLTDNKVHGIFTTALLSGLRGQAADKTTGQITAASLKSYLYQNMCSFLSAEEQNNPDISKEPHVLDQTKPTAPMIFAQIAVADVKKVKVSIHVPAADVGKTAGIFGNDDATPIQSEQNVPAIWEVELPKGLYEVRLASGALELIKVNSSSESQDVRFS